MSIGITLTQIEFLLVSHSSMRTLVDALVKEHYNTKAEFFKKSGIDKATYSRLCTGSRRWTPNICKKIAPAINTKPELLAMIAAYYEVSNDN